MSGKTPTPKELYLYFHDLRGDDYSVWDKELGGYSIEVCFRDHTMPFNPKFPDMNLETGKEYSEEEYYQGWWDKVCSDGCSDRLLKRYKQRIAGGEK